MNRVLNNLALQTLIQRHCPKTYDPVHGKEHVGENSIRRTVFAVRGGRPSVILIVRILDGDSGNGQKPGGGENQLEDETDETRKDGSRIHGDNVSN